jgi:hypothetical protein
MFAFAPFVATLLAISLIVRPAQANGVESFVVSISVTF